MEFIHHELTCPRPEQQKWVFWQMQKSRFLILEIKPSSIQLTNAKTKWGSCSNNKNIRLSWRLIQTSSGIIDYVICHELAHLKHMNHSKLFWHEVERIFPEYKIYKKQLKDQALSLFTLD